MKKITSLLALFLIVLGINAQQVPEVSADGARVYYKIKNKTSGKYATVVIPGSQILLKSSNELSAGSYWFFEKKQVEGQFVLKNYNANSQFSVSSCAGAFDSNDHEWVIASREVGNETVFTIKDANASGDAGYWNNAFGKGQYIAEGNLNYGSGYDNGNSFFLEKVEDAGTLPALNYVTAENVKLSTPGNMHYYTIINTRSGKYACSKAKNNLLRQENSNGNVLVYWYFEKGKSDGTIQIKNAYVDGSLITVDSDKSLFGEGVDWLINNLDNKVALGSVAIVNPAVTEKNAKGELKNAWNDKDQWGICYWTENDGGSTWLLNEVSLPIYQDSEENDVNGVKLSNPFGLKHYYTLEAYRQNYTNGPANSRYGVASEVGDLQRVVNPESDVCKWYFVDGGEGSVYIYNEHGYFLNSSVNTVLSGNLQKWQVKKSSANANYVRIVTEGTQNGIDAHNYENKCGTYGVDNEGTWWTINPVENKEVSLSAIEGTAVTGTELKNIATFSCGLNVTIPTGVEAYIVKNNTPTSASLTKVEGVLPANTGVVLLSNDATASFSPVFEPANAVVEGNLLKASSNNVAVTMGANDYVLANDVEGTQFYKATEQSSLAMNKAYLQLAAAQANAMVLNFGGEATGIEAVVTENANAPIYDLSGRRVINTVKGGIYIQNGKKFIVK